MPKWHDFVDRLKDEGSTLAKEELKELVASAKADSNDFIRKQGRKMERYLSQMASGSITSKEFEGYMRDLVELTRMEAAALSQAAQTRAHRLATATVDLILKALVALL